MDLTTPFRAFWQHRTAQRASRNSVAENARILSESGLFDGDWYIRAYPDVRDNASNFLGHFVEFGAAELRDPGPQFDSDWYNRTYADVRASGEAPVFHYLKFGKREAQEIRPSRALGLRRTEVLNSGFFDQAYYLKTYPDVVRSEQDPFDHFVNFGSAEGRSPGPEFEAQWYKEEYLEPEGDVTEPLFHYIRVGRDLGYKTKGPPPYERWIALFDELGDKDVAAIEEHISRAGLEPLTLLIFVDARSEPFLGRFDAALSSQIYKDWQAVFVLDESCSDGAVEAIGAMARRDGRFISRGRDREAAFDTALASHHALVFCRPDILPERHALYMFAVRAAQADKERIVVYADEDRLDDAGKRVEPKFKPELSPVLFNYSANDEHCFLVSGSPDDLRTLLLRQRFVPDLFREAISNGYDTFHIPFVLLHSLQFPAPAPAPAQRSAAEEDGNRIWPRVSIIIPTRDKVELLAVCLESMRLTTNYPADRIEVIVMDNGSTHPSTLSYLDEHAKQGNIKWIRQGGPFNFSRLNNTAVLNSAGEILLFLNNDTELFEPDWLRNLVRFAVRPEVGIAGAKLLYPDRTVQHAGVVLGVQGIAAHSFIGIPCDEPGFQGLNLLSREVSAVTGACLAVRKDVFEKLGGFDTGLAIAFNDVALCLQARRRGYTNIWVHEAVLIHHESKSRGLDLAFERRVRLIDEARQVREKLPAQFEEDPFYSRSLSLKTIYEPAFPPRRRKPWTLRRRGQATRLLMLSSTLGFGYGVTVVLKLQAEYLAAAGFDVVVGGPASDREVAFEGCTREELGTPQAAAIYAIRSNVDCVITHTPPFFSIGRYLGSAIPHIAYDYGEPPPAFFPEETAARLEVNLEKRLGFGLASHLAAISEAVRAEAHEPRMVVVPLANDHLAVWEMSFEQKRRIIRQRLGWGDEIVILNVCRFFENERLYKGVDRYMDLAFQLKILSPDADYRCVIAGRAGKNDAAEIEAAGISAFVNLSDEELSDLYVAADLYCNFSKWEGYNLGIAQALAMGLPVVASDIPAHRAFPIHVTNDLDEAVATVVRYAAAKQPRKPVVTPWEACHERFAGLIGSAIDQWNEKTRAW